MIDENDTETIEEYTRRLAKNRYDMRMHFKWRLSDTADDDYRYASEIVRRELAERNSARLKEGKSGDRTDDKGPGQV